MGNGHSIICIYEGDTSMSMESAQLFARQVRECKDAEGRMAFARQ